MPKYISNGIQLYYIWANTDIIIVMLIWLKFIHTKIPGSTPHSSHDLLNLVPTYQATRCQYNLHVDGALLHTG